MPHKVVITQSTAGRSGPPQTMLDVLNEAGLDVEVAACAVSYTHLTLPTIYSV